MSTPNYPDTMNKTHGNAPAGRTWKLGFSWYAFAGAIAGSCCLYFGIPPLAVLAAALGFGVVSYRRFVRQQRRKAEAEAAVGVSSG